ncbi:polysaccharide biosynthesis/export family protein [Thioflavicoccus mobilis]|nr:polysaccharide biosynthesis/export family protein [Thioflavicoccus mobilis]
MSIECAAELGMACAPHPTARSNIDHHGPSVTLSSIARYRSLWLRERDADIARTYDPQGQLASSGPLGARLYLYQYPAPASPGIGPSFTIPARHHRIGLSMLRKVGILFFAMIAAAFLAQGCQSTGSVKDRLDDTGSPADGSVSADMIPAVRGLPPDPGPVSVYRIAPDDLLSITVFQVEELSSEQRVLASGEIYMPLVGAIEVAGLTPDEAQRRIAAKLEKNYLQNPQVRVSVEEAASQKVVVIGAVNAPGVYPIKGRTTLLQAIAQARGLNSIAADEEVVVFRGASQEDMKAYVVSFADVRSGKVRDPMLIGGDTVQVPESASAKFFKGLFGFIRGPSVPVPAY